MLKLFRQRHVTKLILWAILILILPAFVIWGTGSLGRSKDKGPTCAGLIDGKKVSFNEFRDSLVGIRSQIILNYFDQPKIMETFLKSRAFLGKLAWDRLLMAKEAGRHRINVSDSEVVSHIRSHPIFLRGGQFDSKIYDYILRYSMGLDARSFEEIIRENLAIQKLNGLLTKDIKVTDEEAITSYRKDNEKIKISYILFSSDSFLDKVKIGEADVKDYYEAHKEEISLPAKGDAIKTVPATMVGLDDVKESIKKLLTEKRARDLASKFAEEQREKLGGLMAKERLTFEAASEKLGLKTQASGFFLRTEYLEGIGEAAQVTEEAVGLNKDETSKPVNVRGGTIIFRILETQKFDEEKFKKEKDEYSKLVLEFKKTAFLEKWLTGLEQASKINIDFKDYEKYYR